MTALWTLLLRKPLDVIAIEGIRTTNSEGEVLVEVTKVEGNVAIENDARDKVIRSTNLGVNLYTRVLKEVTFHAS